MARFWRSAVLWGERPRDRLGEVIEPNHNDPEHNEPESLEQVPIDSLNLSQTNTLGSMLPGETIAAVIVDTVGDWQGINQFDLFAEPINGLIEFPHILTLPDQTLPTTLDEWSGEQIALAWLPSERVENGSYGITIAPLSNEALIPAAANAQRYRDAIAANWSRWDAVTETQTYRGIDILLLFEPPRLELTPFNLPVFDIDNPPSDLAPIPQTKESTAVDRPDPSAAPEPELIEPSDPNTPSLAPEPQVKHAIAQLDDRLLFASSLADITDYVDALNLGDPLATLPPLDLAPAMELDPPSEVIAAETVDRVDISDSLDPETVDPLVDRITEALTLSDVPAFQAAIAREPETAAAIVYADMPRLLDALGTFPLFSIPQTDGTTLTAAEIWDTLDIGISTVDGFLWFEPSGAWMQFRANYTDPQPKLAALARTDDETLQHIPAASAIALTTRGFDVILPEILAAYDQIPELQAPLNQARDEIRSVTGFDLDADIVPLFDGDLSFFVFPSDRSFFFLANGFLPLGAGITIETSDRPKLEALIAQVETQWLDQIRAQTSDMKTIGVTSLEVEGLDVTSWNLPSVFYETLSLLGYTWVSDDTLLISTGADLMAELLPTPYQSLLDSYTYQSAIEPFPQPNISLFHLNVGSILALLNDYFPVSNWGSPSDTFDLPRFVQSFRSISESTTATENYAQDDVHIQLAPRRSE
ncbi:MAG: DUF3352 domain-containing protein [Coleofasciculaceae cyanobacterium RL_1_1]|nr:DUF3352 domain-containing protein [Coleofasciculaceae cyanobacterium RL_1_1]